MGRRGGCQHAALPDLDLGNVHMATHSLKTTTVSFSKNVCLHRPEGENATVGEDDVMRLPHPNTDIANRTKPFALHAEYRPLFLIFNTQRS